MTTTSYYYWPYYYCYGNQYYWKGSPNQYYYGYPQYPPNSQQYEVSGPYFDFYSQAEYQQMLQSNDQVADVQSTLLHSKQEQDKKTETKKVPPLFHETDLTAFLKDLQDKVEAIEEENEKLKEKIEDIKPITIENINYKIQELTVKDLSGALNIGMTALTDPENIQQLMNEQGEIQFNDMDTEDMQMEDMNEFENEEPENNG